MIHFGDLTALQRILNVSDIPKKVEDEYAIRRAMYCHADGDTGAMGAVALIDMVRALGYGAPVLPDPQVKVDWREYPQDGSTVVEARFFGEWMRGRFLGFVQAGSLAIRLDRDEMVKECRPGVVRLVGISNTVSEEVPDAMVKLLEPPPKPVVVDEKQVEVLETAVDEVVVPEFPEPDEPKEDWSIVVAGTPLWIEGVEDEPVADGAFVSIVDAETLLVRMAGETDPRCVAADSVRLVS